MENTSENIEELKVELGQLEPELKDSQEEAQKLTGSIATQRNVVTELRSQMELHEEKVKVRNNVLDA